MSRPNQETVTAPPRHHSAEDAPSQGERRLRALVNASSDAVYRMSADWSVMYQLKRNLQQDKFLAETEEADPNWLQRYIYPEDQEKVRAAIAKAIQTQEPFDLEHRVWKADAEIGWTHSRAVPVQSEEGEIQEWFGMAADITARKHATEQLIHNEKLAAMGRLASSIAHEVNNPLESVTNLVFLARTCSDIAEVREYLAQAEAELSRAVAISNQTLRFHKQSSYPTAVKPEALLCDVLQVHRARIGNAKVYVESRYCKCEPVHCYEGEIRQVVSNLVGNATDAMKPQGGGRLIVRTHEGYSRRGSGRGIFFTVADTGPGMSPETKSKLFQAFYSTKGLEGTGLGLWVSQEIAERHGGELRFRSSQDPRHHGTVFMLFLPFAAISR